MKFRNYELYKENVVLKILDKNTKANKYQELITMEIMDITIGFYYLMMRKKEVFAAYPFSEDMMNEMNIKREELYELALKNAKIHSPMEFIKVKDFMYQLYEKEKREEYLNVSRDYDDDIYMITNQNGTGAVGMLDQQTIDIALEELNDSFVVLPSSEEEVLVLAASNPNIAKIAAAVKDAHLNAFEYDMRFSDSIYFYDRTSKEYTYQNIDDYINEANL